MDANKDYPSLTRESFERLKGELRRRGSNPPDADSGEFQGSHGLVWRCRYDGAKQVLHLSIVKKPFYIPYQQVWNRVDSAVERAHGGGPAKARGGCSNSGNRARTGLVHSLEP